MFERSACANKYWINWKNDQNNIAYKNATPFPYKSFVEAKVYGATVEPIDKPLPLKVGTEVCQVARYSWYAPLGIFWVIILFIQIQIDGGL
jgi:hypothetical protein